MSIFIEKKKYLTVLLLGFLFVVWAFSQRNLRLTRFGDYDDQVKLKDNIRLYFENFILLVSKTIRRKLSERKRANRTNKMKYGNRRHCEL